MNTQVAHALFSLVILFVGVALGWAFRGVMDDLKRAKEAERTAQKNQQAAAAHQQMHQMFRKQRPDSSFGDIFEDSVVNKPSKRFNCPLPECQIRGVHSHTEALIRKMKGH